MVPGSRDPGIEDMRTDGGGHDWDGGSPGAGRLETGPFCVCPCGDPVLADIGRRTSGGG